MQLAQEDQAALKAIRHYQSAELCKSLNLKKAVLQIHSQLTPKCHGSRLQLQCLNFCAVCKYPICIPGS